MAFTSQNIAGYFFLAILAAFVIGMFVDSVVLERRAKRAAEKFTDDSYFVNIPKVPQQIGVTDHDYWVKKNNAQ
jgi:hypothetical protein